MPSNLLERTLRYRFKQPSTNHKETRQTEEYKHRITPIRESPKQKWQTCAKTTRIIVNPRIASMYSILCLAISPAKVQKKVGTFVHFNRKCYFCIMKERINWIDWAKAFCMTVVVFCHLPQQEDTFYLQYLASVILSTFFFISGYLKKKDLTTKESAKKYGYSLLIPYIIYNAIYYPYWLVKFYIEHGSITLTDAIKPITGTLLGQLNSSFSCELNGVTWFLIALFIMHILTDMLNKHKHGKSIMFILSIISMILYGANKYYHYAPYITYHGLIRCLCFFFLGNLYQQLGKLKQQQFRKRLTYRNIHPTRQPHPILLAHQRETFHSPHYTILCGKSHIRICLHIPSKIPQHHKESHHHPNLHRHNVYLRSPQNDDWHNRFRNRKGHPSLQHFLQLDRMPCISTHDRNSPITNYHLQKQMSYSFR